jgi:hypothetical protein
MGFGAQAQFSTNVLTCQGNGTLGWRGFCAEKNARPPRPADENSIPHGMCDVCSRARQCRPGSAPESSTALHSAEKYRRGAASPKGGRIRCARNGICVWSRPARGRAPRYRLARFCCAPFGRGHVRRFAELWISQEWCSVPPASQEDAANGGVFLAHPLLPCERIALEN